MKNSPSKKLILFDIDYTLFDKDYFFQTILIDIANALNLDVKRAQKVGQDAYDEIVLQFGHFEPKEFITKVTEKLHKEDSKKEIEKIVLNKYRFPDSLYEESFNVVEEVAKIGRVGIFSKGHTLFQKRKITKIRHLLSKKHVHITNDKYVMLPEIIKKYKEEKLYFVDDLLGILEAAKKIRSDIVTIWVKRGEYAKKQRIKEFIPDKTVHNLRAVISIVKNS